MMTFCNTEFAYYVMVNNSFQWQRNGQVDCEDDDNEPITWTDGMVLTR